MPLILDQQTIRRLQTLRKTKRFKPVGAPVKAERDFHLRMAELWKQVLLPATEKIRELVKRNAPPGDLADVIEQALLEAQYVYGVQSKDIIWRWRASLDQQTRAAFNKRLGDSLSIDITALLDDPVIADALARSGAAAAEPICNIPTQYLGKIAQAVSDNFKGTPLPEGRTLLQQIDELGVHSKKRAKLIARDQTAKLTATLNQIRQQDVGIDTYIWRTVKDRRVVGKPGGAYPEGSKAHGDHFHMEGKLCRWADATVFSKDGGKTWIQRTGEMPKAHPGQQIQCRCHAEPVIDVERLLQQARGV